MAELGEVRQFRQPLEDTLGHGPPAPRPQRPRIEADAARHRRHQPFNSPDWLFEIKNDGYRMLAEFGAGPVAMRTRGGHDCSSWFPEIVDALAKYKAGPFIVDGEVCA